MKVLVLSEIVILFAICLQSKNAVYSEEDANSTTPDGNASEKSPLPDENASEKSPLPDENASAKSPLPDENASEKSPLPDENASEKSPLPDENASAKSPLPDENTSAKSPLPDENASEKSPLPDENASEKSSLANNQNQQNETSSSTITEPPTYEKSKTDANGNDKTSKASISLATTKSIGSNNNADEYFTTRNPSGEILTMPEEESNNKELRESNNQEVARIKNKSHKSAAELIASHTYNNSFVLTNLLNFSRDKHDVSPIGEPVNLVGFIENLVFKRERISFLNKTTNFSNIHVSGIPSSDSVHRYYNNFTCTSQHFGIVLNVIPENMNFTGDYIVQDNITNETSSGTFVYHQHEARLSYKIPNISEIHNNGHNLTIYGDIIFGNGQVKFTELCDNQCELLTSSSLMFENIKSHILGNLNVSFISKPVDQFISTFPFLSICSPAPPSTTHHKRISNYYVIEEIFLLGKNTAAPLYLGPMIIKGLDNFISANVSAMKGHLRKSPNHFLLSTQASQIQGQCDWRMLNNSRHPTINHSFTFIIEQVNFSVGVDFSESWNVDHLDIHFNGISIHRSDKNCPKILGFVKMVLEDFVQDAVKNSLIGLFNQRFPKLVKATTTDAPTKKSKTAVTRQVVHWTPFHTSDNTDVTAHDKGHLPFPTRRVFTPCKDTRKWWQKLFYKNKCKDKVRQDD